MIFFSYWGIFLFMGGLGSILGFIFRPKPEWEDGYKAGIKKGYLRGYLDGYKRKEKKDGERYQGRST